MYFTVPDTANGFKLDGNTNNNTTIAGNGNITSIGSIAAASLQTTNNCTVGGSLTVTGSLTTTSFYATKSVVAFYCVSNALSATVRPGFSQTCITLSGTYTFTSPTRPSGINYMVFVQGQTGCQLYSCSLHL